MPIMQKYSMPAACGLVGLFVVLRDIAGLSVSKYIFLFICVVALVLMKTEHVTLFLFFLFPLYAGLPGNYLTLMVVFRLGLLFFRESKERSIDMPLLCSAIGFLAFLMIQNLMKGYTSVYHYALCAEIVLLFLLGERKEHFSARTALLLYALGTSIAGFSALAVYAREYSLSDILAGFVRFGDAYGEGGMRMTLDPNFLGFLCIAGIALEMEYLRRDFAEGILKWETGASLLLLMPMCFLGFVGLSRAFFVCAALLVLCEIVVCARKPMGLFLCLLVLGAAICLVGAFVWEYFSSLCQTLLDRFSWESIQSANGRTALISRWAGEWFSSAQTFLFGVGLFETNVHFTALQYLFGLGVIGGVIAFVFFGFWAQKVGFHLRKTGWIPVLITAVMSCAVPAAASLSAFFPLVAAVMISADLTNKIT